MTAAFHANRSLVCRYQAGDDRAGEELLRLNERLVQSIAARYSAPGQETEDLLQEGRIGLLIAARRFDQERGTAFSTYAFHWIRLEISRAVENAGFIRLPIHVHERRFRAARSGDPAEQEWAAALPAVTTSLDAPSDEEQGPFGEQPAGGVDIEAEVLGRLHVAEVLARLPDRERYVLTRRLDLDGEGAHTLAEVAAVLGRSRENVRVRQEKALAQIREQLAAEGEGSRSPKRIAVRGCKTPILGGGEPPCPKSQGRARRKNPVPGNPSAG